VGLGMCKIRTGKHGTRGRSKEARTSGIPRLLRLNT